MPRRSYLHFCGIPHTFSSCGPHQGYKRLLLFASLAASIVASGSWKGTRIRLRTRIYWYRCVHTHVLAIFLRAKTTFLRAFPGTSEGRKKMAAYLSTGRRCCHLVYVYVRLVRIISICVARARDIIHHGHPCRRQAFFLAARETKTNINVRSMVLLECAYLYIYEYVYDVCMCALLTCRILRSTRYVTHSWLFEIRSVN